MSFNAQDFQNGFALGRATWRPLYVEKVSEEPPSPQPEVSSMLIFSSPSSFVLGAIIIESETVQNYGKIWDGTLEYSLNEQDWIIWTGERISSGSSNKIFLRGIGNTWVGTNSNVQNPNISNHFILEGQNISCNGNMEALLDYQSVINNIHPPLAPYGFQLLFSNCSSLISAPEFLSPSLTEGCYIGVFYNCSSLKTSPTVLPAKTLARRCYMNMFYGCSSLQTAPIFLAQILSDYCCYAMFSGCTSLISAPSLPATSIASYCYEYMFYNCTGLKNPPYELPAPILANYCYCYMFVGCTSLQTTPILPAKILAYACYLGMFYNCRALTTPPSLPADSRDGENPSSGSESLALPPYCYYRMFYNCTSLNKLPYLESTRYFSDYCYYQMFYGCKNIKLSTSKTSLYTNNYRIRGSAATTPPPVSYMTGMFTATGGTFTGTPTASKLYYTSNEIVY